MRPRMWWLYLTGWLAVALVTVSSIALAIRQGSWGPIESIAWLPAVLVATTGSARRRRRPRRRTAG